MKILHIYFPNGNVLMATGVTYWGFHEGTLLFYTRDGKGEFTGVERVSEFGGEVA